MKKILAQSTFIFAVSLFAATAAQATYDNSVAARKACHAPKLKQKQPEEKSTVAPGAKISAVVSSKVRQNSLQISVKGAAVNTRVTPKGHSSYLVEGQIPEGADGFVRIKVSGKITPSCRLKEGWLVQVSGDEVAAAESEAETSEAAE